MDGVADGHRYIQHGHVHSCACGAQHPRRGHFFWSCDVAVAVVSALHSGFCPDQVPLVKSNLWMMHAPVGLSDRTWMVLCLCALNGMDVGRKKLLSLRLQGRTGDADDPEYGVPVRRAGFQVTVPIHSNAERVKMAKGTAIAEFWGRVADWRALTQLPDGGI